MINLLNKRKLGIALGLVLAFSSMFICDALCDVGIIEFSSTHSHNQVEDHHGATAHDHGDDHHALPVASDHDHEQPTGHDHESSEDGECCKNLTSPFFDQLIKHKVESVEFLKIDKIDFVADYNGYNAFLYNSRKVDNLFLYSNLPPPLPGDQIRILFQSFLL